MLYDWCKVTNTGIPFIPPTKTECHYLVYCAPGRIVIFKKIDRVGTKFTVVFVLI